MTDIRIDPEDMQAIAPFKTLDEEAQHWEQHSPFADAANDAPVTVVPGKKVNQLTVRFDTDDITSLREAAAQRGLGPATLVRMWVHERLGH